MDLRRVAFAALAGFIVVGFVLVLQPWMADLASGVCTEAFYAATFPDTWRKTGLAVVGALCVTAGLLALRAGVLALRSGVTRGRAVTVGVSLLWLAVVAPGVPVEALAVDEEQDVSCYVYGG